MSDKVLLGTYTRKIDDKGRIYLPGECRRGLGDDVVTVAVDDTIWLYPVETFLALELRADSASHAFRRTIDRSNRINLSGHAKLTKDVEIQITGALDHFVVSWKGKK